MSRYQSLSREKKVCWCVLHCASKTHLPQKKHFFFDSIGANKLKSSFELPLNFPLLIELLFLPTGTKTINQNSMKVKGGKAVNSCQKGLPSSLKSYDTGHGSMDYPISRLSHFPKWQSIERLLHEP